MADDLLQDTIDDQPIPPDFYTNVTEATDVSSSSTSGCCQDSCPEQAAVTVVNNTFSIATNEVKFIYDVFDAVATPTKTLSQLPIAGHEVTCFFDGSIQEEGVGADFTIDYATGILTPVVAWSAPDLKVGYWYLVV